MKITYYITPADAAGWSAICVGRWLDTSKPIAEAAIDWPCVGVVNSDHEIEHLHVAKDHIEIVRNCMPLWPGMTISWEENQ